MCNSCLLPPPVLQDKIDVGDESVKSLFHNSKLEMFSLHVNSQLIWLFMCITNNVLQ